MTTQTRGLCLLLVLVATEQLDLFLEGAVFERTSARLRVLDALIRVLQISADGGTGGNLVVALKILFRDRRLLVSDLLVATA